MKTLFTILILLTSTAMAAKNLSCSSEAGHTLNWNPQRGELNVVDLYGNLQVSESSLVLGETRIIETFPIIEVTPIQHSDRSQSEESRTIATIEISSGQTKVLMGQTTFTCP